jgi:hypothetical protein
MADWDPAALFDTPAGFFPELDSLGDDLPEGWGGQSGLCTDPGHHVEEVDADPDAAWAPGSTSGVHPTPATAPLAHPGQSHPHHDVWVGNIVDHGPVGAEGDLDSCPEVDYMLEAFSVGALGHPDGFAGEVEPEADSEVDDVTVPGADGHAPPPHPIHLGPWRSTAHPAARAGILALCSSYTLVSALKAAVPLAGPPHAWLTSLWQLVEHHLGVPDTGDGQPPGDDVLARVLAGCGVDDDTPLYNVAQAVVANVLRACVTYAPTLETQLLGSVQYTPSCQCAGPAGGALTRPLNPVAVPAPSRGRASMSALLHKAALNPPEVACPTCGKPASPSALTLPNVLVANVVRVSGTGVRRGIVSCEGPAFRSLWNTVSGFESTAVAGCVWKEAVGQKTPVADVLWRHSGGLSLFECKTGAHLHVPPSVSFRGIAARPHSTMACVVVLEGVAPRQAAPRPGATVTRKSASWSCSACTSASSAAARSVEATTWAVMAASSCLRP